jgi:hypothetical protein
MSPRIRPQSLPEVVDTCRQCDADASRGTYKLNGHCGNCSSDVIGVFTKGHSKPASYTSPPCPVCGCRELQWRGLRS